MRSILARSRARSSPQMTLRCPRGLRARESSGSRGCVLRPPARFWRLVQSYRTLGVAVDLQVLRCISSAPEKYIGRSSPPPTTTHNGHTSAIASLMDTGTQKAALSSIAPSDFSPHSPVRPPRSPHECRSGARCVVPKLYVRRKPCCVYGIHPVLPRTGRFISRPSWRAAPSHSPFATAI